MGLEEYLIRDKPRAMFLVKELALPPDSDIVLAP